MTEQNKQILIKRIKSLAWGLGMMSLAALVNFLATNLNLFNMPTELTVIIGLVLAQISKTLNSDEFKTLNSK